MGVNAYIKELWGWKALKQEKTKEVTYYRKQDGSPYQDHEHEADQIVIDGKSVYEEEYLYTHDKYEGLTLLNFQDTDIWYYGIIVESSNDIMYGSQAIELSNQVPQEILEFQKKHNLPAPKHYALGMISY